MQKHQHFFQPGLLSPLWLSVYYHRNGVRVTLFCGSVSHKAPDSGRPPNSANCRSPKSPCAYVAFKEHSLKDPCLPNVNTELFYVERHRFMLFENN